MALQTTEIDIECDIEWTVAARGSSSGAGAFGAAYEAGRRRPRPLNSGP